MAWSRRSRLCAALAVTCALWNVSGSDAKAPPRAAAEQLQFTGFVVDQANVLGADERRTLTDQLDRFQQETGHQMVVVTVRSLGGEDIGTFTTRLGNRWGVGRRGLNDGIVMLVAPNERRARIAVGRGLERKLPNAFCDDVMKRRMIPAFKRDRIGAGIAAGMAAIAERLKGDKVGRAS